MASDKEIEIKVKTTIETAESARSLGDIKKSIKELKSLALEVGEGGKGFTNLTKQANELQDKLDDLKDSAKSLQGTGIEKLKSSFGLLKESFTSFDTGKAQIALQGLGSAMKAVPIFLVIEGIRFLIENFDKLKNSGGLLGSTFQVIGKIISGIKDAFIAFSDAIGLTNTKLAEATDSALRYGEAMVHSSDQIIDSIDKQIAAASAYGQTTLMLERQKQEAIEASAKKYIKHIEEQIAAGTRFTYAELEEYRNQTKNLEDAKFQQQLIQIKYGQAFLNEANRLESQRIDLMEDGKAKDIARAKFNYEQQRKSLADLNQLRSLGGVLEENHRKELAKIDKKYDDIEKAKYKDNIKNIEAANKDSQELYLRNVQFMTDEGLKLQDNANQKQIEGIKTTQTVIINTLEETAKVQRAIFYQNLREISGQINQFTQAIGQTLNSIVGVFQAIGELNQQRREEELKAEQEKTDSLIAGLDAQKEYELSKEGLTNEQKDAINKKYAQQEYQLRLLQYNRETEVKKKAFEQDKKLKIAQTIISTVTGAVSAFVGMVQSIPGPVGLVLGALSAAAVTAMGVIQITKIREQKFDAGSPPSPPSTNVGGSTNIGNQSSTSPMEAPNLRRIGRNVGEEYENENGNGNSKIQVVRAYVTSEDIENSQNKNSVIKRRSSF